MSRATLLTALLASLLGSTASAAEPAIDRKPAEQFRAECAAKAAALSKTDSLTYVGKDGWLFLARELRHVGVGAFWGKNAARASSASRPENADPLPTILDFKAQLDKAGVELILLPVPPKCLIYPDKVSDQVTAPDRRAPRLDVQHQEFYSLLGKHGVKVIDLVPELLAERAKNGPEVFCKQDVHWSGHACVLAARAIARQIGNPPWLERLPKLELARETRVIEISGDLWKSLPEKQRPPKEKLPLRFVGRKTDTGLAPVEPDRNSPVVLLADSHGLIFHLGGDMHAKGAGFPDQLAAELGVAVDRIATRGSGATPVRITLARRARKDKNYLAHKKLVIWCLAARDFTESFAGWRKVQLLPSRKPKAGGN